jgi:sugar phosphate permease
MSRAPRFYYGWVIVFVALVMNIAASPTNAVVFSFFIEPMRDDLGWSRSALSLALTARLMVAGISAPLLGPMVDRIGARVLGTLAGATAGASILALALVHDLWLFYLLFAISGLSGFGGPAGQLLTIVPVSKWFRQKRGRALAIASTGMAIGVAIFLPIPQAIIDKSGWRFAWFVCGLIVVVLAVPTCGLLMRKDPESMGLPLDGIPEQPEGEPRRPVAFTRATHEEWRVDQVVRTRSFWLIMAALALNGLVLQGVLVYRTTYWEDIGLSSNIVALGTSVDPITVVFSTILFGLMAERVATHHLGLFAGLGVGTSMLPMLLTDGSAAFVFAHGFLWGFAIGANITVNNIIFPNYFGRRFLGAIRGLTFPVTVFTAAVSAPIFGLLFDVVGSERIVWVVPLVTFWVSGLLLFTSRPPRMAASEGEQVAVAVGAG